MRDLLRITKALADPNRVRVLLALQRGELCVCQISELFQLAPSTISKHLSILHNAGLIESRKDERWCFTVCRIKRRPPRCARRLPGCRSRSPKLPRRTQTVAD